MTSQSRTLVAGRLSILFVDDDPRRHEAFAPPETSVLSELLDQEPATGAAFEGR